MSDSEVEEVECCRCMGKSLNVILTNPQILDCYICCEPLSVPVFQCENGHISCSACCTKVANKCPSCSLPIGFIRCRAIETVMESIKMDCPNRMYGCGLTMNLNLINEHKSVCNYQPLSCPLSDCSFVGSTQQLASHLDKHHHHTVKIFSYDSTFKVRLNNANRHRIFQAEGDGVLFILTYSIESFGNALTVNRIGSSSSSSSSEEEFCFEIKATAHETGSVVSFQSVAKEIQGSTELLHPSEGSLLLPNHYFGYDSKTNFKFRIWPAP